MVPKRAVSIIGLPKVYSSSETGRRTFCSACGTGLFFTNGPLDQMGMLQVRIAALDDPDAVKPKVQVQVAERINWVSSIHDLPAFDRFPGERLHRLLQFLRRIRSERSVAAKADEGRALSDFCF
jgi:hypothetical protein